jgi:hypothetical protein
VALGDIIVLTTAISSGTNLLVRSITVSSHSLLVQSSNWMAGTVRQAQPHLADYYILHYGTSLQRPVSSPRMRQNRMVEVPPCVSEFHSTLHSDVNDRSFVLR